MQILDPLTDLVGLEYLEIGRTPVNSLQPLKYLRNLKYLSCPLTKIDTLAPLDNLTQLEYLDIYPDRDPGSGGIYELDKLSKVYCEETAIGDMQVKSLLKKQPDCRVFYKSDSLALWWESLLKIETIFKDHVKLDNTPGPEQLHAVIYLDAIKIDNARITSLEPLSSLLTLKHLAFTNTSVSDLSPLKEITSLLTLECSRNPIQTFPN